MKKLAISAPSDEELYTYSTSLRCFACSNIGEPVPSDDPKVSHLLEVINTELTRRLPLPWMVS